jgi:hypothetical protein
MGTIIDPAIIDYSLSISDCYLVPITNYRLWQTVGSFLITITCHLDRQIGRQVGRQTDRQREEQKNSKVARQTGR